MIRVHIGCWFVVFLSVNYNHITVLSTRRWRSGRITSSPFTSTLEGDGGPSRDPGWVLSWEVPPEDRRPDYMKPTGGTPPILNCEFQCLRNDRRRKDCEIDGYKDKREPFRHVKDLSTRVRHLDDRQIYVVVCLTGRVTAKAVTTLSNYQNCLKPPFSFSRTDLLSEGTEPETSWTDPNEWCDLTVR